MIFTAIGLPLARAVAPACIPPLALAPTLGWAVYVAIGLPVLTTTGFAPGTVTMFSIGIAAASYLLHRMRRSRLTPILLVHGEGATLKVGFLALAAAVALLPLAAIMPKSSAAGILLAPPLFDHVKIAIVDAILRDGLPVPNPFIGPASSGHLAYYYLWHVGAAMLASTMHVGGWAAEAAMTGFTAFASLLLVMGVVVSMGGGTASILSAVVLILPGSMRPILAALIGSNAAARLIPGNADIGTWLNQSAWVPQHLASACCVIVSTLLMLRLAQSGTVVVAATLGLCVASGFGSSLWVGGIAFAASGAVWGITLLVKSKAPERSRFIILASGAALLTAFLILPLVVAELRALQARQLSGAVAVSPYRVFGALLALPWRHIAELPGFWLVLLPFSLPAIMPLGLIGLWKVRGGPGRSLLQQGFLVLVFACLAVVWLLRSTIDNNDLGWRAALPPILLLAAFAGCGVEALIASRNWRLASLVIALAALGIPDSGRMIREYLYGWSLRGPSNFATSEPLWQALRRHAGPDDRIANNPLAVANATTWPVNIAWATLSDRPSCYAGWATAIAYATLPRPELARLNDMVLRVFAGHAEPGDVATLAHAQNCAFAVVSPEDGAWANDPFAVGGQYALVESAQAWRIYRRITP